MRVVILHDELPPDARPDEQDTLAQAKYVGELLRSLGHDVSSLPLSLDLESAADALRRLAPDAVFNLVEAVGGQGRLIHLAPALLESLRIPFTGAGSEAMFLSTSKTLSKRCFEQAGLDTPRAYTRADLEAIVDNKSPDAFVPAEYIIKSVWEHASLGLNADSVIHAPTAADLLAALDAREPSLGHEAFAEQFIDGREFNVALLEADQGVEVLPIAEMVFVDWPPGVPRIVGYDAKWAEHTFEYTNTVRRFDTAEPALARELARVALCAWNAMSMRDYARVDVRVDARGKVWVLEVNANPCLSPDAGYHAAGARAGRNLASAANCWITRFRGAPAALVR
ncbi:MAG: D-alanine--D-alanine ligase [Phycisphaerales bacterium]